MKSILLKFATVAALALAGVIAHAQSAPMMVHYQGRLTQPNGLPLTSPTASVAFEIFPSASGGTRLWPPAGPLSSYTVVLRNGGIFSVMLGDTSIPGMPALTQSVFQQGIAYLQISIAGTAVGPRQPAVGPRQPIVSVPWSILSQQATTVADGAISTPKLADGAVTSNKLASDAGSLLLVTGGVARIATNGVTTAVVIGPEPYLGTARLQVNGRIRSDTIPGYPGGIFFNDSGNNDAGGIGLTDEGGGYVGLYGGKGAGWGLTRCRLGPHDEYGHGQRRHRYDEPARQAGHPG